MSNLTNKMLILASSSPRRQELIGSLGLPFEIKVSDADETVSDGLTPAEIVEILALRKASTVYDSIRSTQQQGIIIGSDTIVYLQGQVLGKPMDEEDSFRMLSALQGNTHQVYSGLALLDVESGRQLVSHRVTQVTIKSMQEDQIRRYIATGEPNGKAGSYAIQGIGAVLIEGIEGDYFNVVGLPLNLLANMLGEMGVQVL